ncbi:transcriptional regulator GcvA [Methylorubrum extorquens]|uniref:transcriptional regulator GcvA n=1 Tax=Methylorubrum extorquens TaxID=408 RepID=UPI00209DE539|nr:transcriptional regulator GcvA [Methylorubrum extorquens]MCP1536156.1 LysR family glycine cleavage system transcriptional activator [Methylorubrum extorquens]
MTMRRSLPPLATLRAFEAAGRRLSFRGAADELGVTPTAISHQIRLLEQTLGLRLFHRETRRVRLTAEGAVLLPVLRDGFDAFAEAIDQIRGRRAAGVLTLSAPTAFVAKWLVPRLADFRAAHPACDLRLHASDSLIDFARDGVDVAVRYGPGPYSDFDAHRLLAERVTPACSPHLAIRSVGDLRHHTLLHFEWPRLTDETPTWPAWLRHAGVTGVDGRAGIRFSDEGHVIQAAIAGQGIALLSDVLTADELASGALIQPFGPVLDAHPYWVVRPRHSVRKADVEKLVSWLVSAAAGSVPIGATPNAAFRAAT